MRSRRRLLWVVLGLWLAWVVLANVFLLPGVGPRLIARHPERFAIGWQRAWSVLPGLIHVRGFHCGGHTRDTNWRIEVARGRVLADLPLLALRTFHGLWPRADGVSVRVERAQDFVEPRRRRRAGFRVLLQAASIAGIAPLELREITIEGLEWARGTFSTQARGAFEVPRAKLRFGGGRVTYRGEVLADELEMSLQVRVARHVPSQHRDTGPLPFVFGRADVTARLGDLSLIKLLLRKTPLLELEGGRALLTGEIVVEAGALVEPTAFTVAEAEYSVRYLDAVVASGVGTIFGGRSTGRDGEAMRLELNHFELARPGATLPYAHGGDLTVRVLSDRVDLRQAAEAIGLVVEIPRAELVDLGGFDGFVPERSGLDLLGGRGDLSSRIELDLRSGGGASTLDLAATDISLMLDGRELGGDLVIHGELQATDARSRRFEIHRLDVALDDVAVAGERRPRSIGERGRWWGRVRIEGGELQLARPLVIEAPLEIQAMDARPILAVAAGYSKAATWVDRLITTDNLRGTARIAVGSGPTEVRELELVAGQASVEGELCLERGRPSMVLLLSVGDRHAGLERSPDDKHWHLRRPRRWFAERRPDFECAD